MGLLLILAIRRWTAYGSLSIVSKVPLISFVFWSILLTSARRRRRRVQPWTRPDAVTLEVSTRRGDFGVLAVLLKALVDFQISNRLSGIGQWTSASFIPMKLWDRGSASRHLPH
jgi:hypothetical protein